MVKIGVTKISESAEYPQKATEHSAAYDVKVHFHTPTVIVYNAENEVTSQPVEVSGIVLYPGERALIPTGLIFNTPPGWSLRLHPRSGLSLKSGLSLINCEGIIDADYRHETFVAVMNHSSKTLLINHGDKIAQIEAVPTQEIEFTDEDNSVTTTRVGGFGSTGI